jgi:hypothetical protein
MAVLQRMQRTIWLKALSHTIQNEGILGAFFKRRQ